MLFQVFGVPCPHHVVVQSKIKPVLSLAQPEIEKFLMKSYALNIVRIEPAMRKPCMDRQEISGKFQRCEANSTNLDLGNRQGIS
ncbi:hypothetical protein D3C87_1942270 [compost metagenome]